MSKEKKEKIGDAFQWALLFIMLLIFSSMVNVI